MAARQLAETQQKRLKVLRLGLASSNSSVEEVQLIAAAYPSFSEATSRQQPPRRNPPAADQFRSFFADAFVGRRTSLQIARAFNAPNAAGPSAAPAAAASEPRPKGAVPDHDRVGTPYGATAGTNQLEDSGDDASSSSDSDGLYPPSGGDVHTAAVAASGSQVGAKRRGSRARLIEALEASVAAGVVPALEGSEKLLADLVKRLPPHLREVYNSEDLTRVGSELPADTTEDVRRLWDRVVEAWMETALAKEALERRARAVGRLVLRWLRCSRRTVQELAAPPASGLEGRAAVEAAAPGSGPRGGASGVAGLLEEQLVGPVGAAILLMYNASSLRPMRSLSGRFRRLYRLIFRALVRHGAELLVKLAPGPEREREREPESGKSYQLSNVEMAQLVPELRIFLSRAVHLLCCQPELQDMVVHMLDLTTWTPPPRPTGPSRDRNRDSAPGAAEQDPAAGDQYPEGDDWLPAAVGGSAGGCTKRAAQAGGWAQRAAVKAWRLLGAGAQRMVEELLVRALSRRHSEEYLEDALQANWKIRKLQAEKEATRQARAAEKEAEAQERQRALRARGTRGRRPAPPPPPPSQIQLPPQQHDPHGPPQEPCPGFHRLMGGWDGEVRRSWRMEGSDQALHQIWHRVGVQAAEHVLRLLRFLRFVREEAAGRSLQLQRQLADCKKQLRRLRKLEKARRLRERQGQQQEWGNDAALRSQAVWSGADSDEGEGEGERSPAAGPRSAGVARPGGGPGNGADAGRGSSGHCSSANERVLGATDGDAGDSLVEAAGADGVEVRGVAVSDLRGLRPNSGLSRSTTTNTSRSRIGRSISRSSISISSSCSSSSSSSRSGSSSMPSGIDTSAPDVKRWLDGCPDDLPPGLQQLAADLFYVACFWGVMPVSLTSRAGRARSSDMLNLKNRIMERLPVLASEPRAVAVAMWLLSMLGGSVAWKPLWSDRRLGLRPREVEEGEEDDGSGHPCGVGLILLFYDMAGDLDPEALDRQPPLLLHQPLRSSGELQQHLLDRLLTHHFAVLDVDCSQAQLQAQTAAGDAAASASAGGRGSRGNRGAKASVSSGGGQEDSSGLKFGLEGPFLWRALSTAAKVIAEAGRTYGRDVVCHLSLLRRDFGARAPTDAAASAQGDANATGGPVAGTHQAKRQDPDQGGAGLDAAPGLGSNDGAGSLGRVGAAAAEPLLRSRHPSIFRITLFEVTRGGGDCGPDGGSGSKARKAILVTPHPACRPGRAAGAEV